MTDKETKCESLMIGGMSGHWLCEEKGCLQVGKEYCELCKEYKHLEKENAELEKEISVLLSCADCSENKGGYICEKEYNDKCLAQKIEYIKELEKENAELSNSVTELTNSKTELENKVTELEKQIVKMKNCQNCKHSFSDGMGCMQRARHNWCYNYALWELAE